MSHVNRQRTSVLTALSIPEAEMALGQVQAAGQMTPSKTRKTVPKCHRLQTARQSDHLQTLVVESAKGKCLQYAQQRDNFQTLVGTVAQRRRLQAARHDTPCKLWLNL